MEIPPARMLRMRAGVGVRADVLAYLLGTAPSPQSVRAITHATRYTQAPARRTIADLVASSFVQASAGESGTAYYTVDPRQWSVFLGAGPWPAWQGWHDVFAFGVAASDFRRQLSSVSDEAAAAALARRVFGQHPRAFARLDTGRGAVPGTSVSFLDWFTARTSALARWAVTAA